MVKWHVQLSLQIPSTAFAVRPCVLTHTVPGYTRQQPGVFLGPRHDAFKETEP